MKMREIRDKSIEELKRLLLDYSDKRLDLNFKMANKQLKNIREIRDLRKNIARIQMVLLEKEKTIKS
ncbi:50S ribosomal protein L29 [Candidatus Falkowbacteria bacterium]|nr:50S ribosomal protein L29 [Candidatus Falkowbacteria bacterium]